MTQEERAAIQERLKEISALQADGIGTNNAYQVVRHYLVDISALLDESESCNKYLGFTAKEWHEKGVRIKEGLEKALVDCMIDRDRWKELALDRECTIERLTLESQSIYDRYKARAEVYKQAILDYEPCWACVHDDSCEYSNSNGCTICEFEFNEAQFVANDGSVE